MKKLLIMLLALLFMAGCSDEPEDKVNADEVIKEVEQEEIDEVITEVVSEQDHDVVLFDNEDLKLTLLSSVHERYENASGKDEIDLTLELENKKNRTFEFYIKDLTLDGVETNDMKTFFDAEEIAPNETIDINLKTFTETDLDDFELNFEEHLSGIIIFSDHEGDRIETSFSEYINE